MKLADIEPRMTVGVEWGVKTDRLVGIENRRSRSSPYGPRGLGPQVPCRCPEF